MSEICRAQKKEGAALGFFNPSVIAWDLGQGKLAKDDPDNKPEPTKLVIEIAGRIAPGEVGAIKEV